MPDWSYQTLFRPLLFRLPPRLARGFTLHAMGALSRLPGGAFVIRTLGHMELSPLLHSSLAGVPVAYPVGLSGGLDLQGTAHKALSQFGFGFIEIGPVTVEPVRSMVPAGRDIANEAIVYADPAANEGLERIVRRLAGKRRSRLPQLIRLRPMPGRTSEQALSEQRELLRKLAPYADAFYIEGLFADWSPEESADYLQQVRRSADSLAPDRPLFVYIPLDYPKEQLALLLSRLNAKDWSGAVVGDAVRSGDGFRIGRDGKQASLDKLRLLRVAAPGWQLIAAGGVHEPADALELQAAGAEYVQLHSGLVYAGPGLPKRINEALIYERIRSTPAPEPTSFWRNWGWMCLLGIGMIVGGLLALLIAATSVLLPYDERFLGLDRAATVQFNHRILHFMSHDRITLAGTMLSLGIFYYQLARHGMRRGLHWAKTAATASCAVGFSSFFLYLGYGYFDPLHAAAGAILLPMFLLSLRGWRDLPSRRPPNRRNDRVWRLAQYGQTCFVTLGFALGVGGLTIAAVGVTYVFVPTDLQFIGQSADQLAAWNERLIPLIAHDRAGFGGALFAMAVAIAAAALWGVSEGERWLWWTLLLGGLPGFGAGLIVHVHIGYTNFWHLAPVYVAVLLYMAGLILLYPYLVGRAGPDRRAQ